MELELFNPELKSKPQVVCYNKMDLPDAAAVWPEIEGCLLELVSASCFRGPCVHLGFHAPFSHPVRVEMNADTWRDYCSAVLYFSSDTASMAICYLA